MNERKIFDRELYRHTDLATECYPARAEADSNENIDEDGLSLEYNKKDDVCITRLEVKNKNGEDKIKKPIGHYVTVDAGPIWQLSKEQRGKLIEILADEITSLSDKMKKKYPITSSDRSCECILIVGLGNRLITADSIGPLCVDEINVTRHLRIAEPQLFSEAELGELAAISPGVVGQTGIETAELVKCATETISPSMIVVIDALAARNPDRLANTIQLCDTGISPGSGIGNIRRAINYESLGIPVIAIGVPTIVDSSTLVIDALERAEVNEFSDKLIDILENGKSFFVSLKESDIAIQAAASIIASAINSAFNTVIE